MDVEPLGKKELQTKMKLSSKSKRVSENVLPSYKAEDLKLPKKFAEKVLELELEVDHGEITVKQL